MTKIGFPENNREKRYPMEEKSGAPQFTNEELAQGLFKAYPTPLFYAANPEHILYGKLGEEPTPMPIRDFEQQTGVLWTNSPVTGQLARDLLFKNLALARSIHTITSELLCNPFNGFAIFEVNATAGKGVCYWPLREKTKQVLNQGTLIGLYSGSLETAGTNAGFFDYGFIIDDPDIEEKSAFHAAAFGVPFIDGQRFQNMTNLMLHAPDQEKLDKIAGLSEELKKYVVTANVAFIPSLHVGIPVLFGRAQRDIQPKEQFFHDYGDYGNKAYQLFDMANQVIGTVNAENQFEINPSYKPCGIPAPRCHPNADEEIEDMLGERLTSELDSYSHHLVRAMAFSIELFQHRNIPETEKVLAEMLACFDKKNDPSMANRLLCQIISRDKKLDPFEALMPLKAELMNYSTHLNHSMSRLKSTQQSFRENTKKPWVMGYDSQSRIGLCLFGRKTVLRETKKELSWIPSTLLLLNNKDCLMIYFSALLLHENNNEKAAQAQSKKPATPGKKK